jgi:hypothetical protein
MRMTKMKGGIVLRNATLVVGIGEVGSALATVLERAGEVLRHDLEPREFDQPIGVMHICFPFSSHAQFIATARSYIERFKPSLTIVNSTVVPGTTRALARACHAPIVYSPVRGKHARMTEDLMHYVKFVSSTDARAAQRAREHFESAGMKTRTMRQVETLELAKLAETTYFGLLIAFAQEMNRFAQQAGADYDEAYEFFDEVEFLPRWRYFPGFIGGHCVIPNVHLLKQVAASPLLDGILDSNQRRAEELKAETSGQSVCEEMAGSERGRGVLDNR